MKRAFIATFVLMTASFASAQLNPQEVINKILREQQENHRRMEEQVRKAGEAEAARQKAMAAEAADKAAKDTKVKQMMKAVEERHATIDKAHSNALPALAQSECQMYYSITSTESANTIRGICGDLGKHRRGEVARYYALQYNDFIKLTLLSGPGVVENITATCLKNANLAKGNADAGGLLACLDMARNANTMKLAEGNGTPKDYFNIAKKAKDPTLSYSAPTSQDDAKTRAKVRSLVTHTCVAEATSYVQALCVGITVHELFARDPYGDNGEIAKAINVILPVYNVGNAPQAFIQQQTGNVLHELGLPQAVITLTTNPGAVVNNPGQVVQQVHDALPCFEMFGNKC
jgi:ribosomal protein L9